MLLIKQFKCADFNDFTQRSEFGSMATPVYWDGAVYRAMSLGSGQLVDGQSGTKSGFSDKNSLNNHEARVLGLASSRSQMMCGEGCFSVHRQVSLSNVLTWEMEWGSPRTL